MAGTALLPLQSSGVELKTQTVVGGETYRGAAILVGPADARPVPGDEFFDDKVTYAYVYQPTDDTTMWTISDGDDQWTDLSSDGIWTDGSGNGLAELPNHDGIDIAEAAIGWTDMDSFVEEEDTFDVSSDGTTTVTFTNTYKHASPAVGGNQGEGSASWFGWQRDANGNITGMDISHDVGTLSTITVRWHVQGNQTRGDYFG